MEIWRLEKFRSGSQPLVGRCDDFPSRCRAAHALIDRPRNTIRHLRDNGLIRTIALDEHDQAVVLKDEGRDLLDANRRERDGGESQVF